MAFREDATLELAQYHPFTGSAKFKVRLDVSHGDVYPFNWHEGVRFLGLLPTGEHDVGDTDLVYYVDETVFLGYI